MKRTLLFTSLFLISTTAFAAKRLVWDLAPVDPKVPGALRPGEPRPAGKVVVAGKIKLNPPVTEAEYEFASSTLAKNMKGLVLLMMRPEAGKTDKISYYASIKNSLFAKWDRKFLMALDREQKYLQAIEYFLSYNPGTISHMPGMAVVSKGKEERAVMLLNLTLDIRPEDQAIYIGTILIERTPDNQLKSVSVRDDFEADRAWVKKTLGEDLALRKALAKQP